jgi:hypothetical protein
MAGESLEKTCSQKVRESIFFSGLKTEKKKKTIETFISFC